MLQQAFNNTPDEPGLGIVQEKADESADRLADAEYRATHDSMTGLLNKEAFKSALAERVERAENGNGNQFGVIFIDLKDFKKVNDELGHEKGDEVIIASANLVQHTVRAEDENHPDLIANEPMYENGENEPGGRLGGDEIAVLLDLSPGTDKRDTELTPEMRLEAVQKRIFETFYSDDYKSITDTGVGISIGGAVYKQGETATELLDRADKAMYQHKQEQKEQEGSYR